jgi:hypothetical protein
MTTFESLFRGPNLVYTHDSVGNFWKDIQTLEETRNNVFEILRKIAKRHGRLIRLETNDEAWPGKKSLYYFRDNHLIYSDYKDVDETFRYDELFQGIIRDSSHWSERSHDHLWSSGAILFNAEEEGYSELFFSGSNTPLYLVYFSGAIDKPVDEEQSHQRPKQKQLAYTRLPDPFEASPKRQDYTWEVVYPNILVIDFVNQLHTPEFQQEIHERIMNAVKLRGYLLKIIHQESRTLVKNNNIKRDYILVTQLIENNNILDTHQHVDSVDMYLYLFETLSRICCIRKKHATRDQYVHVSKCNKTTHDRCYDCQWPMEVSFPVARAAATESE